MLSFTQYRVVLQVTKPIIFSSYPGFYIRNALVKALSAYCMEPDRVIDQRVISCKACPLEENCLYHALNLPVEQYEKTPKVMPFMVNASNLVTGKYEKGNIEFELTLFGNATRHIEVFCSAIETIGRYYGIGDSGTARNYKLVSVRETTTMQVAETLNTPALNSGNITLYFRHLKLADNRMKDNQPLLPLGYLLQIISSRINELNVNYGEALTGLNLQIPSVQTDVLHTEHLALCNYQYSGNKMGYWFVSGNCTYNNVSANCMNLLILGSVIGIGRFTSYGFGTYSIQHE